MQGIAQKILANPGKYSIQQLQQGVEHGIIPAYIAVPLIQEKVMQQKQMQMAQAMQQGPVQDQPTIAQQVMQEARGVEALPTNLPAEYAHGGIVAFEEGGPSNKYETVYDRMNRLNREAEERDRLAREEQARAQGIMPYGQQMSNVGNALLNVPVTALKTLVSAPGYGFNRNTATAPETPFDPKTATRREDFQPSVVTPAGAPAGMPSGAGTGITGLGGASATMPGIGGRPTLKMPEGTSYQQMATDYFTGYGKEAAERDTKLEDQITAEREKVKGQAFDDYKKSLEKEALSAGADRDQAKYMSLFKAGLAMMAGTSRHALENIGKGAMVGAEDFQSAIKDLKKSEKERQKELANIEQARRAEALGDRDTAIKRLDAARDRADARTRYVGEGIYKATGMDKAQAFELAKTQFSSDSDIFRTQLAGQYQVAAAGVRANQKEGISQYQLARLRADAEKQVDPNTIRAQLAQQLKLSKPPKPGADPTFEQRFQQAYAAAIDDRVNRNLGVGGGASAGQGFQLPQGYKLLGAE